MRALFGRGSPTQGRSPARPVGDPDNNLLARSDCFHHLCSQHPCDRQRVRDLGRSGAIHFRRLLGGVCGEHVGARALIRSLRGGER